MNFINLRVAVLRSPEYLGCEPVTRATWLNLLAYCHEQENGGIVAHAAAWGDRQWQQVAGVTRDEILSAAPLVTIRGDDIVVWGFDKEKQREVQARRVQAGEAARRRWDRKLGGTRNPQPRPSGRRDEYKGSSSLRDARDDSGRSLCGSYASRIASRNAEGEVEGECVVCVEGGTAADRPQASSLTTTPTTTTSAFDAPTAHPPNAKEDADRWIARLKNQYPAVDFTRELRRATAYTRKKRGEDAPLQRRFFEFEWLPRCAEQTAPERLPASESRKHAEPAPEGWSELIRDSAYGPDGDRAVARWDDLPADVQSFVIRQIGTVGFVKPAEPAIATAPEG